MSNGLLDRAEQLTPLVQKARPEPAARALARAGQTPRQYLSELMTAKHFMDAVRVLAWALPRREALWWACQCVRQVITDKDGPAEQAALQAATRYTDRKSTRLNSSHLGISYAVFCLKKKKNK